MKVNYKDIDTYSSNIGTDYFTLKDDGDSALVRILISTMDDLCVVPVHEQIKVDNRDVKVACLRGPKDSIETCPFCDAGKRVSPKVFIELMVYETDSRGNPTGKSSYQVWERGRTYISKLEALVNRYAKRGPLWDTLFEITRSGAKNSQQTTYEILPVVDDELNKECPLDPDSLPDPFDPVGSMVYDKTFEEMEYYTKKGKFPTEQRDVKDEDDFEEEPARPQGRRKVEPRVEPIEELEEVEQPAPVRRRRIG